MSNAIKRYGAGQLVVCLLVVAMAWNPPAANAQSEDTTFTARLSGSSEVSPVATAASGIVTATLEGDSLFVSGSFSDLSSAYIPEVGNTGSGAHLHMALAGSNGGVEVPLEVEVDDAMRSGTIDEAANRFELTEEQRTALLERRMYVNVHTEDYPAGEIRGQVLMDADGHYEAILTGGSENPSVNSGALGAVVAEHHGDSLFVSGSFHGLESNYAANAAQGSGAHLHLGLAGQNGGVEIPLEVMEGDDNLSGMIHIADNRYELSAEQQGSVAAREMYANIHSADHQAGEIRGQLVPVSDAYFEAIITGTAKTPSVDTEGSGALIAEVRGDSVFISGSFSDLASNYAEGLAQGSGAHLHLGLAGTAGGIQIPLGVTVGDDDRSGTFASADNRFELTSEQLTAMRSRHLYANIHSDNHQAGEIRGQVLPLSNLYMRTSLSGLNEVDPDTSSASGGVAGEVRGNELTVSGSFSELTSALATDIAGGAHLHMAGPDANGEVIVPLAVTSEGDMTSGEFLADENTYMLEPDTTASLRAGMMYANVHSENFTPGEIRGQMLLSPNGAPDSTTITDPADGAMIEVAGNVASELTISWDSSMDPNGNDVVYIYQLSSSATFHHDSLLVNDNVGEASTALTYGAVDTLLDDAGIDVGSSVTLYHRVIASDGSDRAVGESTSAEFTRGTVTATDDADELPRRFVLKGNYPNPFNPSTTIRFDLPQQADVTVDVFDVMGRRVMSLPRPGIAAGSNRSIQVDASVLPSGAYFYRVQAEMRTGTSIETGKMMLVK